MTRGSPIPAKARALVKQREHHRCCRCGVPAPTGQWHHRRRRNVIDTHRHCTCNGVWLCPTCHAWVHSNVILSVAAGFIVSAWIGEPGEIMVRSAWGDRYHDCEGTYRFPLVQSD